MAVAGETDACDNLSLLGPVGQLSLLVITCVTNQSCYLDSKVTRADCDQLSLLQL